MYSSRQLWDNKMPCQSCCIVKNFLLGLFFNSQVSEGDWALSVGRTRVPGNTRVWHVGRKQSLGDNRGAKGQVGRWLTETKERPFSMSQHHPRQLAGPPPKKQDGEWKAEGWEEPGRKGRHSGLDLKVFMYWGQGRSIQRRDGARFWGRFLRRALECGSGKGQGHGWPQDLWLGEQRWGVRCPVSSHMGEGG